MCYHCVIGSFRGIIICAGIFSLKVWHIIIATFRGIIRNFRGIIICAGIFRGIIGNFRGIVEVLHHGREFRIPSEDLLNFLTIHYMVTGCSRYHQFIIVWNNQYVIQLNLYWFVMKANIKTI